MLKLAVHRFIARDLRSIEAGAQTVDLIIDFAPAFIQSVRQSRINSTQLLLQRIEFLIESLGRMFESLSGFFSQVFLHDSSDHVVRACKKICQPNPRSEE